MFIHSFFLLATLFACLPLQTYSYPPDVFPIDWQTVSETPYERNLDSPYLGECICDQTWGLCDPNCCCDRDCSEAARKSFTHCLPEQNGYPDIEYCSYDNNTSRLKRINSDDENYAKRRNAFRAVCVVRTNHPNGLYKYFKVPSAVSEPKFNLEQESVSDHQSSTYKVGQPMLLLKLISASGRPVYRKIDTVQLPIQEDDGSCSVIGKNVKFLEPFERASCVLSGQEICNRFPVSSYVNLFVAPSVSASQSDKSSTGVEIHIFDDTKKEIGFIDPHATTWDSSLNSHVYGDLCRNAIVRLEAVFVYDVDTPGAMVRANMSLYVKSIPLKRLVAITFQSNFVASNGSIPAQMIPASPGYMVGAPVRAGTLVKDARKSAILERKGGFAVPSGGQACALQNYRTVAFMHSVLNSGCVVPLSEEKLVDLCKNGTKKFIFDALKISDAAGLPLINYIAKTSDALTNDSLAWIPIQGLDNLNDPPGTYNPVARQCTNIMVGIQYKLIIARAGVEYNPQDIVVGAFANPIYGTWQIRDKTNLETDATSEQTIRFQVLFSRYKPNSQATIRRKVVAPPLLPELDKSIFYPFTDS